jgi:hypothetical protein
LVSGRPAAELLSEVLPTREHARLVLRAGLAGVPVVSSKAVLYDAERVLALARRPPVTADELAELCPEGLYVARLTRGTRIDITAPWTQTASVVDARPAMPPMAAALLSVQIVSAEGGLPWVATLCGYVVLCARVHGFRGRPGGDVAFDLTEPDERVASLEGRRLATRPGRPWVVLEPGRAGLSARGGR